MFADDATFALDGTFNSFRELIDVLEAFKSVSGLKLNNKNTVLRIGSLFSRTTKGTFLQVQGQWIFQQFSKTTKGLF